MGVQVKAKCNCGLDKDILIGGGFLNYKKKIYFPCYCSKCKDVVQGNVKRFFNRCSNNKTHRVVPYIKKKLIGIEGEETIANYGKYKLTNGYYKCPMCKQNTLKFIDTGILWD